MRDYSNVSSEIVGGIGSLIQMDVDAVHAYRRALSKIDGGPLRAELEGFLRDHERHIDELSAVHRLMGGEPPRYERGHVRHVAEPLQVEEFASLSGATDPESILKALKHGAKSMNKSYRKALGWVLPPDVYDIVRRNWDDEKRHLSFLERTLRTRSWEVSGEMPGAAEAA